MDKYLPLGGMILMGLLAAGIAATWLYQAVRFLFRGNFFKNLIVGTIGLICVAVFLICIAGGIYFTAVGLGWAAHKCGVPLPKQSQPSIEVLTTNDLFQASLRAFLLYPSTNMPTTVEIVH